MLSPKRWSSTFWLVLPQWFRVDSFSFVTYKAIPLWFRDCIGSGAEVKADADTLAESFCCNLHPVKRERSSLARSAQKSILEEEKADCVPVGFVCLGNWVEENQWYPFRLPGKVHTTLIYRLFTMWSLVPSLQYIIILAVSTDVMLFCFPD